MYFLNTDGTLIFNIKSLVVFSNHPRIGTSLEINNDEYVIVDIQKDLDAVTVKKIK